MEEIKIYNNNELDDIFLSYDGILTRFKYQNIKTKEGNEITHKDLRKAIMVMQEKHYKCRWKSQKVKSKNYYILIEGYCWLLYVYFNNKKKLIDLDIEFFEERIKLYEDLLEMKPKILFESDMYARNLSEYFNRKEETVKKAIWKMIKVNPNYRYKAEQDYVITKEGIEWLCKNCFKHKYLQLLEDYKMELTEKYIKAGYPYDNFFGKN